MSGRGNPYIYGRPKRISDPASGTAPSVALPSRTKPARRKAASKERTFREGPAQYAAVQPEPTSAVPRRLLEVHEAAAYLGVSTWTIRDLEGAGTIRRVRVPLSGTRELRRLLFDRYELDRLIDAWKAS